MASHMQIHSTSSASLRQIKLLLDHMNFCGSIFSIYMLPDKHSVGTRFSNIDHDNSESNLFIKTNMKKLLTSQCRSPQNTKRLIQLSDPFQSLYFELFPLHYLSCSQLYCLQNSGKKKNTIVKQRHIQRALHFLSVFKFISLNHSNKLVLLKKIKDHLPLHFQSIDLEFCPRFTILFVVSVPLNYMGRNLLKK